MSHDLVTSLLPIVGRSLELGFNVFEVMHHGRHEKQLSNVFRWLLDAQGTHNLEDRFTRIFLEELNRATLPDGPLPLDGYWVRQEVNTSQVGAGADIADLVLESTSAAVVIENHFTSDGHGHSYSGYLEYSRRGGRQGAVVLLCQDLDTSLQTGGWENAPVLTYGQLVERLHEQLSADTKYRLRNPDAFAFIEQMHRKFVKGRGRMEDRDVLDFIVAMCETGQAQRYRGSSEVAAEQFANELAEQARERFGEGKELLQRIKAGLRRYCALHVVKQLNTTLGEGVVRGVSAGYQGIYQWTINFVVDDPGGVDFGEAKFQLKFGPSAWYANEQDPEWRLTVDPEAADYSRLFLTRASRREVRQSSVSLQEVLDGIRPNDTRLHDEIVQMLRDPAPTAAG